MPDLLALPEQILDKLAPCPTSGCWLWYARWDSGNGYGKVDFEGQTWMSHRLVWTLLVGAIPRGLILDHLCRVRCCANPAHLEPVTVRVNTHRGEAKLMPPVDPSTATV